MTRMLSFDASVYAAGRKDPPHSHRELQLSMLLSGRISETVGSTKEYATAFSVVCKDTGVVHSNDFGLGGAKIVRLSLSRATLGELIDDSSRSPEWRWHHDARIARPFVTLAQRAISRGLRHLPANDPDIVDLLSAFTARPATPAHGSPPRWLEMVIDELRETWTPRMKVGDIASRAGVHPVYLARCMRRWYGFGVADVLRNLRLNAAAAALSEGNVTVSEIAHEYGFADESHLCRSLNDSIGVTPRRFRRFVGEVA